MVLALRAAGVQPLGGSVERPAAEDVVALADVAGARFLEVGEDFLRVDAAQVVLMYMQRKTTTA